nr:glycosyltransferase [uncultured Desulfobacter sp.]
MKNKLLIINRTQFGYHLDTYYYCKYASDEFDITYIGFDAEEPKVICDNINCIYIERKGSFFNRYFRLLFACFFECRKEYDFVFVNYFTGCSLVQTADKKKNFILDIRTGSVDKNIVKRQLKNLILRIESLSFKRVSVISESLSKKLKLQKNKSHILPLGAETIELLPRKFDSMKLLYVGTFDGRRIEDTVKGFSKFYREFKNSIDITYDIIGDGHNDELDFLKRLVEQNEVASVVRLPGYIHQSKLKRYYQECNVGISYVPINDIYDCQPPTKTYEYLLAGMPVIATSTRENAIVINDKNGVLIKDSANDFYKGLKEFFLKKDSFDSNIVKQQTLQCSWQKIVKNKFVSYLKALP